MGVIFYKGAPGEPSGPGRVHFGAKRTLICSLILTALAWLLAQGLGPRIEWGWGLWALVAWSVVVCVYAVYTYAGVRRLKGGAAAGVDTVDPLTGLPNRKGLVTALEGLGTDVQELGRRVRLIDVDLINLSKVNFEYGQMIGDVVLQDMADILRRTAQEEDFVARLGGDEFIVVLPSASTEEAEALALSIEDAVEQYRLNLGDRGEVNGVKARVSVAAYMPDQASLHETVVRAKEQTAHGSLPDALGEEEAFYHVPRVTLGAFAVHRWQTVSQSDRSSYKQWQREPGDEFTQRMVDEISHMLDEKAETHWADFVTTMPAPGGRETPARHLAEALAAHLRLPYRDVMRADSSGPETRSVEPAVDAVIDKGDGALVVSDVISSGILERRCVKKLSAAGAHVLVIAWAAY